MKSEESLRNAKDSRPSFQEWLPGPTGGSHPGSCGPPNQKASLRAANSRAMPSPALHLSTNGLPYALPLSLLNSVPNSGLTKVYLIYGLSWKQSGKYDLCFQCPIQEDIPESSYMGCWVSQSIISATFSLIGLRILIHSSPIYNIEQAPCATQ